MNSTVICHCDMSDKLSLIDFEIFTFAPLPRKTPNGIMVLTDEG